MMTCNSGTIGDMRNITMASSYDLLPEDLCFLIHLYHARNGVVAFSVKATP